MRTTPEIKITRLGEHYVELLPWHHGQGFMAKVCTILNDDIVGWQHVVDEVDRVTSINGDLRGFKDEVAVEAHLNVKSEGGKS